MVLLGRWAVSHLDRIGQAFVRLEYVGAGITPVWYCYICAGPWGAAKVFTAVTADKALAQAAATVCEARPDGDALIIAREESAGPPEQSERARLLRVCLLAALARIDELEAEANGGYVVLLRDCDDLITTALRAVEIGAFPGPAWRERAAAMRVLIAEVPHG